VARAGERVAAERAERSRVRPQARCERAKTGVVAMETGDGPSTSRVRAVEVTPAPMAPDVSASAVEIHVAGKVMIVPTSFDERVASAPGDPRGRPVIPAKVAIYAAVTPVDLRRSFDGLSAAARDVLGADPRGGALFLFFNRGRDRVKILWYDRNGFCLLTSGSTAARSGCRRRYRRRTAASGSTLRSWPRSSKASPPTSSMSSEQTVAAFAIRCCAACESAAERARPRCRSCGPCGGRGAWVPPWRRPPKSHRR
jgi:hypothetical protein